MNFSETCVEQLTSLKHAKDLLAEADGIILKLTPGVLEVLYKRATSKWFNVETNLLTYEHYSNACCCSGAPDNEPFCDCTMSLLMARFKYDVALLVKERIPN